MKNTLAAWPKSLRITSYVVVGLIALALMVASATVGYATLYGPPIAKARAAACQKEYTSGNARSECRQGDTKAAASAEKSYQAEQKREAVIAKCAAAYSDTAAQLDCANGDTALADTAQKQADEAAAAAEKKATEGATADNPYPAGTQVPMQSTNRLDGTQVSYTEWVTGFNADWRGYDEFGAPDAGMKYVAYVVHVKADDAGVDAGTVAYDASFTDAGGNVYERATVTYQAKPQMPSVTLGSGQQAQGVVVFEVPVSVKTGVATFGDGTVFAAVR